MFTLLVAFAVCAQESPTQTINNELAFTYQMEEFVYNHPDRTKLPEKVEKAFLLLGDSDYRKREKATVMLEQYFKGNLGEVRWLFWGRHDKDREVAFRCNLVLKRLYKCRQCQDGVVRHGTISWNCIECLGGGTLWGMTTWD